MTSALSTADAIDVSILIVSFNTRDMTSEAIFSVAGETRRTTYEIIAVDNASNDESAAMLAAHPERPRLIALKNNIGFAQANNVAAKAARGRYLLLLNPDTIVRDAAIDRLVAFARANPQALIWGGRTLFADGALNPSSCWSRMTLWNLLCRASGLTGLFPNSVLFNGEALGGWRRDSVRRVDIVSGCFFLIERDLWNRLGGFDPLFFMYGEEADLCLRAHALGARPMITPKATIVHYGGASESARTGKMIRLLAAKASLISRHWPARLAPIGLWLNAAWPLSRAVATRFAAVITQRPALAETADVWREIWTRRREWQQGYPVANAPVAASIHAAAQPDWKRA